MYGNLLKSADISQTTLFTNRTSRCFKLLLFGLFFLLFNNVLQAQEQGIQITGSQQSVILADNVDLLEDPSNQLTAEQVLQSGKFKRSSNMLLINQHLLLYFWISLILI